MSTATHNSTAARQHVPKLTAEGGRLPDFVIVGAPKCGTTTLYQYLLRHPGIFMSTPKEMSFFSKPEVYARGFPWYTALFEPAGDDQLCGEASTTYARWPTYEGTAERMADAVPEARLIYLVRNPVDRVYSFYAHRMREQVSAGIDEFLAATPEAIHSGLYMSQLDELLRHFPREQLHVLLLDDLKASPQAVIDGVLGFLGLDSIDLAAEKKIVANQGSGHFAATQSVTRLTGAIKRVPVLGQAVRMVPRGTRRAAFEWLQKGPVGRRLKKRHTRQMTSLTPALRRRLYGHFRDDLDRFEAFLGRDLSHWKEPATGGHGV
ncbi:MAG: sulfotransferase [Planctomycetota bacterium]